MTKIHACISKNLQEECNWGSWNADRGVEVDFRCEYCGMDMLASVDAYYSWQMDHIIPSSQGGEHSFENFAISCVTCNKMKGSYYPIGTTREERVSDAKRFIDAYRERELAELNRIREVVGLRFNKSF